MSDVRVRGMPDWRLLAAARSARERRKIKVAIVKVEAAIETARATDRAKYLRLGLLPRAPLTNAWPIGC